MAQEYTVTAEATMPNIHIAGSGHNVEKVTWTVPSLPSNAIVTNVKFTGIFNCSYTYANAVRFTINGGNVFHISLGDINVIKAKAPIIRYEED